MQLSHCHQQPLVRPMLGGIVSADEAASTLLRAAKEFPSFMVRPSSPHASLPAGRQPNKVWNRLTWEVKKKKMQMVDKDDEVDEAMDTICTGNDETCGSIDVCWAPPQATVEVDQRCTSDEMDEAQEAAQTDKVQMALLWR